MATGHDVEEMFLSNLFDVGIEGVGVTNYAILICGLVDAPNSNGGSKFFGGESVFPDKLPVYAGDVHAGVY